jgi:hypothetical protein
MAFASLTRLGNQFFEPLSYMTYLPIHDTQERESAGNTVPSRLDMLASSASPMTPVQVLNNVFILQLCCTRQLWAKLRQRVSLDHLLQQRLQQHMS